MAENIVEKVRAEMESRWNAGPRREFNRGHTLSVTKYAKELAREVGADEEIAEVAALLHDVTVEHDAENHNVSGAAEAEKILKRFGYAPERIEAVKHCILAHRSSTQMKRETKEAECLASADAMSHFDGVNHLIHLAFTKKGFSPKEGGEWVLKKLARDWDKLMPQAKEKVRPKYEAAKLIFGSNE